jgi:hypothetical protein
MGERLEPRQYSLTLRDYLWIVLLWILTIALRYFVCLVVLVGASSVAMSQGKTGPSVFMPVEKLQYKVMWGFFRLGTIVITQEPFHSGPANSCLISMSVRSSRGLPFINVHFVNNSRKSPTALRVSEETITTGEDSTERTIYWCDTTSGMLYCTILNKRNPFVSLDSVRIQGPCYDALGLFMLARLHGPQEDTMVVPTLNDFSIRETEIHFTGETDEIKTTACDTPVRCRRIDGNAKWVGNSFAGMRGPFSAWITDDEASIPLRAELKIFLGSIVLELESTNRSDWGPKRFASVHPIKE